MHMMVWDTELNMMRGLSFFEPDIPKYETKDACIEQGMKIIAEAKENFAKMKLRTGEYDITCIEVKDESV
jgi:hypothetical protein